MATVIRMARGGAKKKPYYRIVVANSRSPRDGKFIEKLGIYNPLLAKTDEKRVIIDQERVKHWLKVGAKPSVTVQRFLHKMGLAPAVVHRTQTRIGSRKEQKAAKEAAAANKPAAAAPGSTPAQA